jgi:hypothetical protein
MRLARSVALAALLASSALGGAARAQDEPLPGDRAVLLAKEGLELFQQGNFPQAYERFKSADALAQSPVFKLYMARAKKGDGGLIEAREIYRQVVSTDLGASAPASWTQAVADGRAELAALEPTIPTAVVRIAGGSASTRLEVDGKIVQSGKSIELDPGEHRAVAKDLEKNAEATATFVLEPGDKDVGVSVDLGKKGGAPAPGPGPGPGPTRPDATAKEGSLIPGIALLSAGGAGLLVGAITGGLALSIDGSIMDRCGEDGCSTAESTGQTADQQRDSLALAHVSTTTLAVGAALAVTGVILVVVRPGGEEAPVRVSVGPAWAGLELAY